MKGPDDEQSQNHRKNNNGRQEIQHCQSEQIKWCGENDSCRVCDDVYDKNTCLKGSEACDEIRIGG